MHPQPRVPGRSVVNRPPAIDAPMHNRGRERLDPERPARRHGADLVIETPDDKGRCDLVYEVAFDGLRWPVEDLAVAQRSTQFDVLGMCPDERHRGPGRMADGQLPVRNVGAVPHLLRQETALARKRFHCIGELASHVGTASGELVVATLASQERPAATDSRAVEWSAIGVFAVSIALISMPDGTSWRLHFEGRVDHLHGV